MMIFYFNHFFQILITPPGLNLVLALIGILLMHYSIRLGKIVIAISLAVLWLLSTPFISQKLIDRLQYQFPTLSYSQLNKNDSSSAIVVLDAGVNTLTPEYSTPMVSESTLERLRYAAFLYKKTNIPVLVSGYYPIDPQINETNQMAKAMEEYFGVPTRWKEDRGDTTAHEGVFATEMLKKSGITKIYLVTKALHMPRSVYAFQNKGLIIIPAPTGYVLVPQHLGKISYLLPTMDALRVSSSALHEYIGILWYRLNKSQ